MPCAIIFQLFKTFSDFDFDKSLHATKGSPFQLVDTPMWALLRENGKKKTGKKMVKMVKC